MSITSNLNSPSKDSIATSNGSVIGVENLSRDVSRLSLFSTASNGSQDEQFRAVGHAEHSLLCMQDYLLAGKLCDVILITENKKIKAHKLVLSAASTYFSAMFTGNLREANEAEITMSHVKSDDLQAIVNYCYTGTVEIREDNVETLLSTASLMQLNEVVEACSRFLAQQLHPSNCLGISIFAEHIFCVSLLEKANLYINDNFMQVIKNQEFLSLTKDQMVMLLRSNDLNVSSEQNIFEALMLWVQHDHATRSPYISELLKFVKLPLLEAAFLVDSVEPAVGTDPDCRQLIIDAMKWHLLPERRQQMMSEQTKPRKSTLGHLLVVGGMDKNKGPTTIESYDPRGDKWTVAYNMNGRRLQFGIALFNKNLLVVGGRDGLKTLNSMECLCLDTKAWVQLSPMLTHRHGLGIAVIGGALYAVGGHDGWNYLNTVEMYDHITKAWKFVEPMQSSRCSAGVAVLGGKLYAVGGRDGSSCLKSVESYDPYTNRWTSCSSMARRRGGVGVAVANGYLYAIGGQDAPANNPAASRFDCVERYDPSTDTWTVVASLSSRRYSVGACLFGDRVITVGGYDGSNYLHTVEQYDPDTNEWTTLAPLLTGRAGACVVPVKNQVICAEG